MSRKTPALASSTASQATGGGWSSCSSADAKPGIHTWISAGLSAAHEAASRPCLRNVAAEKFVISTSASTTCCRSARWPASVRRSSATSRLPAFRAASIASVRKAAERGNRRAATHHAQRWHRGYLRVAQQHTRWHRGPRDEASLTGLQGTCRARAPARLPAVASKSWRSDG
eukprot:scaffold5132_cov65-Phaeocystis_antarctica.AAC.2